MSQPPQVFDPLFPNRPWTVCFYSFRGGVGRTTLAVTAAKNLRGGPGDPRVCLVDFDLEAPGLDEFETLKAPAPDQKGLVEYVRDYCDARCAPDLRAYVYGCGEQRSVPESHVTLLKERIEQWGATREAGSVTSRYESLRRISEGVFDASRFFTELVKSPRAGDVDSDLLRQALLPVVRPYGLYVMHAGRRDRGYREFLAHFDWNEFYKEKEGGLFFENLRAGVRKEFGCEYMIVDCRTGLSGIGSACLGQLADAVVLVYQPTRAHRRGLRDVVQAIRQREKRESDYLAGLPIPRLYVASRAPPPLPAEADNSGEASMIAHSMPGYCEDTWEMNRWPNPRDPEHTSWRPRPELPTIACVRARDDVSFNAMPDSWVVEIDRQRPDSLDDVQAEHAFLHEWIEWTRETAMQRNR